MLKSLSLGVLILSFFAAHAEMPAEIDPGNCETRVFLENIHPDYHEAIRKEIADKGWIDWAKQEKNFSRGYYQPADLTLTVGLRYNLNMPTSNFVNLRWHEHIPYPDASSGNSRDFFYESNWTVGKSTRSACEATKDLIKALPKCMAWNSPLLKKDKESAPTN